MGRIDDPRGRAASRDGAGIAHGRPETVLLSEDVGEGHLAEDVRIDLELRETEERAEEKVSDEDDEQANESRHAQDFDSRAR